jgi:endonuclease YncB( thermonuclease family)
MLTSSLYIGAIPSIIVEYEIVSRPSYIRDGDTFEIPNYPAIRLADVNCPEADEYGGSEATYALTQLIGDRTVYLDARAQSWKIL